VTEHVEQDVDALWAAFDELDEATFLARMDELAARLPPAVAAFERASAFDSTGHEHEAVSLYEQALELGLEPSRHRRAVIQLASSLRNVGRVDQSIALLRDERAAGSDELDDAVEAFLALALVDAGREREAVAVALAALAKHLPRYQCSLASYARDLSD
jgi:tetratricopeptide (TPR) repeat protein